jgi:hypothetical protein
MNILRSLSDAGDPSVAAKWRSQKLQDDPVKESNKRVSRHAKLAHALIRACCPHGRNTK